MPTLHTFPLNVEKEKKRTYNKTITTHVVLGEFLFKSNDRILWRRCRKIVANSALWLVFLRNATKSCWHYFSYRSYTLNVQGTLSSRGLTKTGKFMDLLPAELTASSNRIMPRAPYSRMTILYIHRDFYSPSASSKCFFHVFLASWPNPRIFHGSNVRTNYLGDFLSSFYIRALRYPATNAKFIPLSTREPSCRGQGKKLNKWERDSEWTIEVFAARISRFEQWNSLLIFCTRAILSVRQELLKRTNSMKNQKQPGFV